MYALPTESHKIWTSEEDQTMLQHYGVRTPKALAKEMGRTIKAVVCRANFLKVPYYPSLPEVLTPEQRQLIIGSLFGDAHCRLARWTPALQFCTAIRDAEYLCWKYQILKPFCGNPSFTPYTDRRGYTLVQFNTRSSLVFWEFYSAFYNERQKVCPKTLLYDLSPLGLAVWYMDDGSISKGSARIATMNFGIEENYIIQQCFREKWNIVGKVQFSLNGRTGHTLPYLEFNHRETDKLISLVRPFILSSMSRKIGQEVING